MTRHSRHFLLHSPFLTRSSRQEKSPQRSLLRMSYVASKIGVKLQLHLLRVDIWDTIDLSFRTQFFFLALLSL